MKFIGFNTMPIQQFILLSSINKINLSSDELPFMKKGLFIFQNLERELVPVEEKMKRMNYLADS